MTALYIYITDVMHLAIHINLFMKNRNLDGLTRMRNRGKPRCYYGRRCKKLAFDYNQAMSRVERWVTKLQISKT